MRLVLLGGGGFRTPLVVRALRERHAEIGLTTLVLHDVDVGRLTRIADVVTDLAGQRPGPTPFAIRTTTDLDEALDGADMVFAAIRVGGAAGRVRDERRALDLGVLGQETVGAGGLTYAMRTLPTMLDVADRIARLAPQAWLLNFTNPAGLITEALTDVLDERVIGICDSPVGLIRRACRALGLDPSTVRPDYVGINHLGWLRALVDPGGVNRLPDLLGDPALLATIEEGRVFGPELIAGLGALPNEYLAFYYAHRDLTADLQTGTTRGEVVAGDQHAFYAAGSRASDPGRAAQDWEQTRLRRERSYLAEARGEQQRDEGDLSGGGYENVAIDLMTALRGAPTRRVVVGTRNGSALPQLPADLLVEVPGTVDAAGVHPDPVTEPLTLHQLGLIAAVRASERTLVQAVRQKSRRTAELAFELHPLIGSPRIARALVDGAIRDHPELVTLLR